MLYCCKHAEAYKMSVLLLHYLRSVHGGDTQCETVLQGGLCLRAAYHNAAYGQRAAQKWRVL